MIRLPSGRKSIPSLLLLAACLIVTIKEVAASPSPSLLLPAVVETLLESRIIAEHTECERSTKKDTTAAAAAAAAFNSSQLIWGVRDRLIHLTNLFEERECAHDRLRRIVADWETEAGTRDKQRVTAHEDLQRKVSALYGLVAIYALILTPVMAASAAYWQSSEFKRQQQQQRESLPPPPRHQHHPRRGREEASPPRYSAIYSVV